MPKKPKKPRSQSTEVAFDAAVEAGDLAVVRGFIKKGYKPDAQAAELAAMACNEAFANAHMTEAPMFGRKPSRKQQERAGAAVEKYYQMIKALVAAGAPSPDSELLSAARSGNDKLALLLIESGADVNYDPPAGTPLECAIKSGNLKIVRALIKAGADIHHEGIMGTLLSRAVLADRLPVAEELIKAGVDVNAETEFDSTALLTAVSERRAKFVLRLLNAGADINQKGTITCGEFGEPEVRVEGGCRITHVPNPPVAYDSTPLIVAVRLGFGDIARLLIKAGADLEAVDKDGFTALVYASKNNDQEMVKLLTDAGAKRPKYSEGSPEASFMEAAKQGDCQRLRELITEGLDVNLQHGVADEPRHTALVCAAENGQADAVRLLLAAGANVDEKCGGAGDNSTALMHAASKGQLECTRILIEAGASAVARDRSGKTPMHYAAAEGHAEVLSNLAKAGARADAISKQGESPLMEAAGGGHVSGVKRLLELGADPNCVNKNGFSALTNGAMAGHAEVVEILLNAGASAMPGGSSPMRYAASAGHRKVVDLLIKARSSTRDLEQDAPLINAALMGQTEIARALLIAGANPNQRGYEQFTPLMSAVRSDNTEMVKMLLEAGAELNATNSDGETALDLAYDNIKAAKDQAKFLKMVGRKDMDRETREALDLIKKSGPEDDMTQLLKESGAKLSKELNVQPKLPAKPPKPAAETVEVPDFSQAAKANGFKQAINDLALLCGGKAKPLSKDESDPLAGCVAFELPKEQAEKILKDYHSAFLKRGFYLMRKERGYTSGKDKLALLPTADWKLVLQAFQTNGCNCNVSTPDIVRWLDELAKTQPFLLTGAGFDWCEGHFTKPIKNTRRLAQKMYEFCPDIVTQGTGDVARLALELKKSQRFYFWWD